MQTKLRWRRGFFPNFYKIYSRGHLIGELKDKTFSQTSIGELSGKKYIFKTKGIFKQHTVILDHTEKKMIGEITFNNLMTKAKISVNGKKVNWKYDNLLNTKWSVYNSKGIQIKYTGSSTAGIIDSNVHDELFLLCGLFVTNYYWQLAMVIFIAVFVPIWAIVLN